MPERKADAPPAAAAAVPVSVATDDGAVVAEFAVGAGG